MPLSDQPPPDGADDHAVTPGAAAGTRPTFADQLDSQDELWHRNRRRLIRLLVAFSVVAPFFSTHRPGAAGMGFLIPATAAFIVMTDRILLRLEWRMTPGIAWAWLTVMTGTALAILAVGGPNWVNALVIAGAAIGRISPSPRDATIGAACCVAAGLGVGLARGINYGNGLTIVLVPAMAAFFAYAATRRNELVRNLRETRAELARMAVADERLRIARDSGCGSGRRPASSACRDRPHRDLLQIRLAYWSRRATPARPAAPPGCGCEQHAREKCVKMFRPFAGAAIAAGVLAGGLALGLTAAGAATTGTRATASARTSAARSSGSTVAAHPRAGTASASPSPATRPRHKCTSMPGGGARPGGGSGPGRPSGSAPASS